MRINKPVSSKATMTTKDGECQVTIVLELNINLNTDDLHINVQPNAAMIDKTNKNEDEQVAHIIPDFSSTQKIEFGKKG